MNVKPLDRRTVLADFNGGQLTSDAGVVLLEQADRCIKLLERFAGCFRDSRDARFVEHPVLDLVRQRVFGLALGYEDLNDHDDLSRDPMLATAVGKADPTGQSRRRERDKGRALAGFFQLRSPLSFHSLDFFQIPSVPKFHAITRALLREALNLLFRHARTAKRRVMS